MYRYYVFIFTNFDHYRSSITKLLWEGRRRVLYGGVLMKIMSKINSEYYMPTRGCKFYLQVFYSISRSFAALTPEISSWTLTLGDKIHIHKQACNIPFIAKEPAERRRSAGEAAEYSAARRMLYAEKFSIGLLNV